MNTVEILTKAKELISDPARWARGYYAYTRAGELAQPNDDNAVRWCSLGALAKVEDAQYPGRDPHSIIVEAYLNAGFHGVAYAQDHRTHAQALEMFDKAIELAKIAELGK